MREETSRVLLYLETREKGRGHQDVPLPPGPRLSARPCVFTVRATAQTSQLPDRYACSCYQRRHYLPYARVGLEMLNPLVFGHPPHGPRRAWVTAWKRAGGAPLLGIGEPNTAIASGEEGGAHHLLIRFPENTPEKVPFQRIACLRECPRQCQKRDIALDVAVRS